MNKNSRIFVAGHSGLVGSAVYRNLKRKGYKKIIVISRKNLDLKDQKKVDLFFKKEKIDYLIICAALAGGVVANNTYPVEFFNENILIQNSLLNAALKFKIKRTIFLGTSCIYPYSAKTPIKEDSLLKGQLHETNEAYAIAKIAGIKLSKAMYKEYNMDIVALMPTNIYGINDKYNEYTSHVIPGMIKKFITAKNKNKKIVKLWGDGKPIREFLYSDDLAEAIYKVLKSPKKKLFKICNNNFPIINVGSGDFYTIKKLANLIKQKVDFKGKVIFDKKFPNGVMNKNLSFVRIKKLNWMPSVKLKNGIDIILNDLILRN
jgi:GDP-L-fucose synthase